MLIPLVLAAAIVAQPPIVVTPADPTAPFKGDGTAIKFDPACRDFTIDTVRSDTVCAARVAKAEVGPAIAIAATTLKTTPARRADAIKLLERTAAVSDNPAVHYFLGTLLATAELVPPNYTQAVKHLTIAANRGNPAAADLLANLLVAGKGTPRNIERAIHYYALAAANGFPNSAVSLARLYLSGKFVAKDDARALAWLDAAAAVNTPSAATFAALARNQGKINNIQLVPAADPAKVRTVRYGEFDNPDIPPNFGFDPAFQAIHDEPYDDPAILARLERDATSMPTPHLYELARRLAGRDPARSLHYYLLARTRMVYDASRCADETALSGLRAWDMIVLPDMRYLFKYGAPPRSVIDAVLADEAKLPGDVPPWWICRSGMAAMSAAVAGTPGPLQLKPARSWPELRNAARANLVTITTR